MGLIKAAINSVGGVLADQWKEYFYCDSISNDILAIKGSKKINSGRNSNKKGLDNIISNGSVVAVNEGQCMIIVEQGEVVEFCAEAGEFVYNTDVEPSLFCGDLEGNITSTFQQIGKRFTFGGNAGKDQRVYYFNTKEILDNLFGTANPVPFRVVDNNIGLDVDISIRCNGGFSYKMTDPLLFYKNVCGNITEEYSKSQLAGQLKSEFLTALQPAFAKISAMGIRYSAVAGHTMELTEALNEVLDQKWSNLRGIQILSIAINSIKASDEDEQMIKDLQKTAVFRNAGMAAATLTSAQAEAMKAAAANTSTGPMMAFAGMNMANMAGGINAGALYEQAARENSSQVVPTNQEKTLGQKEAQAPINSMNEPTEGWTCSCGQSGNTGKFCVECGEKRPENSGWTCDCGTINQGKFCTECGAKRPQGTCIYKCDKCGWVPEDAANPPRFCPECGDVFDDNDKN